MAVNGKDVLYALSADEQNVVTDPNACILAGSFSQQQDVSASNGKPSLLPINEDYQWKQELKSILTSDYQRCHMCGGFYGSNHSQPICTTCHLFLFPAPDLDDEEEYLRRPFRPGIPRDTKPESEDSGTEEPDSPLEPAEDDLLAPLVPAPLAEILNLPIEVAGPRVERRPSQRPLDKLLESGIDGTSLPYTTAYLLSLKSEDLRFRVQNLTEFSSVNDAKSLGSLVEDLPPEVLLQIFKYFNDMELHAAMNVCAKWAALIESEVMDSRWEAFVRRRWPLFTPHFNVTSWREIHNLLVNSTCCFYCLSNMNLLRTPPIRERAWKHRRLASELRSLQKEPPEGIRATPLDKECRFFQAMIKGPKGSPYEDGQFYLYLQIPNSYPLRPPHVQFITKILHPNVSRHGNIGLDSIHHNWSLALTLSKILLSIQSLLTDPYLKVCMEPDIGRLYTEDRNMFNQMAREWTWKFAMAEVQQVYFGHVDLEKGFSPFTVVRI